MTILTYLLIVVEAIVSFMLIGIILIQKTKSQGMGLAFGSGMGESLFGAQMGNVLTKTTVVLAIIFLVNTTLLAMIGAGRRAASVTDSVTETVPPPAAMPASPPPPMPDAPPMQPPVVEAVPSPVPQVPVTDLSADAPAPPPVEGEMPPPAQE